MGWTVVDRDLSLRELQGPIHEVFSMSSLKFKSLDIKDDSKMVIKTKCCRTFIQRKNGKLRVTSSANLIGLWIWTPFVNMFKARRATNMAIDVINRFQ